MATTRHTTSHTTAAAEPPDGTPSPPPVQPPSPTITYYQQLATQFMADFDQVAQIIPKLESDQVVTAEFVRSYQSVPIEFLSTTTSAVEQTPEFQNINKLDIAMARDTLQLLDAFRPVLDKVSAFTKNLQFTLMSRKALLGFETLQVYDIAKGFARDRNNAIIPALVANMKRDLGRRGLKKAQALKKAAAA
jgi:hypothetical protein